MEFSKGKSLFSHENIISLCVSGVLDTICKEKKVIYSRLLIKLILPSFNQYHFVTVNAYSNSKLKYIAHLHIL